MHDDAALALDVVAVAQAAELLLSRRVPHVEAERAEVSVEATRLSGARRLTAYVSGWTSTPSVAAGSVALSWGERTNVLRASERLTTPAPHLLLELARQVTLDERRLAGSCDASDRPSASIARTAVTDEDELEGLRVSGLPRARPTDRHARAVAHAGQVDLLIRRASDARPHE